MTKDLILPLRPSHTVGLILGYNYESVSPVTQCECCFLRATET